MRTNYSGFALAVSMGLIVLLIGFLALSAAGLTSFGPLETAVAEIPADTTASVKLDSTQLVAATYKTVMPSDVAAIVTGDALFKNNCAQCHAVNEKVIGPALTGITARRPVPWITAWVHNSAKVIASGDDYATSLYEANGKQQMPSFPNFSDKEIKAILTWIESQQGQSVTYCLPPPVVAK